jgi:thiamine biosynthesis lipoprotein
MGDLTDGAFDITWTALWGLWDFKAGQPRLPEADEVAKRIALIEYRRVVVDDEAGTVFLPEPGMALGLGAIAKGYALDVAAKALREAGIESFFISSGGQMMVGHLRGDRLWRIGIRDPRGPADAYWAHLAVTNASVATSGDYERFFISMGFPITTFLIRVRVGPRAGCAARRSSARTRRFVHGDHGAGRGKGSVAGRAA